MNTEAIEVACIFIIIIKGGRIFFQEICDKFPHILSKLEISRVKQGNSILKINEIYSIIIIEIFVAT